MIDSELQTDAVLIPAMAEWKTGRMPLMNSEAIIFLDLLATSPHVVRSASGRDGARPILGICLVGARPLMEASMDDVVDALLFTAQKR
ncbi:hypothetical protein G9464_10685 [Halostella sp. JP-L12]|uniref:hypothetical protein n=1 Tax=Halostella TaxID=1843185 RepID=UPI000EF843E0|nr:MULTISPECIES: hypothetical protein [Halostella]NHN48062.1 hypothetical protein [Halostella sp. JP-L12]